MKLMVQEQQIEQLLKQVEELHLRMMKIKDGKSFWNTQFVIESQILDIALNNYQEILEKNLH